MRYFPPVLLHFSLNSTASFQLSYQQIISLTWPQCPTAKEQCVPTALVVLWPFQVSLGSYCHIGRVGCSWTLSINSCCFLSPSNACFSKSWTASCPLLSFTNDKLYSWVLQIEDGSLISIYSPVQSLWYRLTHCMAQARETKLSAEFSHHCWYRWNIIHTVNWLHHHEVKCDISLLAQWHTVIIYLSSSEVLNMLTASGNGSIH